MKTINTKSLLTIGMLTFSSYSIASEDVMQVLTNENSAVSQIMFFSEQSGNDYVLKPINTFSHVVWSEYFDSGTGMYQNEQVVKGMFGIRSVIPLGNGREAQVCFDHKVPENYSTRVGNMYRAQQLEVTNYGYCMTAPMQGGWKDGNEMKTVDLLVTFE